jgi:hypothetical protein
MAITRAQQAKQLLALGGRIGLQGGGRSSGKDPGPETGRPGRDDREIGARASRTEAAARAATKAKTALGDPDPEVDVLTKNRLDTITNYGKNLRARFRSNPFSVGPFGILENIKQTQKAREMLGLSNEPDDFETNDDDDEGGVNQMLPVDTTFAQAPVEEEEDYYGGRNPFDINRVAFRLMADGGAVMDDEPRQAYGLGSIVKKAARAVKKVAKSDIGKAAIAAAGIYALGGGFGTGAGFSKGTLMSRLGLGKYTSFKNPLTDTVTRQFTKNALGNFLTSPTGIIGATSLASYFMTPKQEEDEDAELDRGEGLDIPLYRRNPEGFLAPRFRAEGGSINEKEKEPVAKKVMPLIDMGGKEKDYRETGGFVDMGRMEKADDVPARLSKNEFVFTADAVRNAGDGSVDKGAEVMYNMMKNLEAGGEVSEESQGLEGARKMFQTSQRLEEVL